MSHKKTRNDPVITSDGEAPKADPAPNVSDADNAVEQTISENPDKPDKTSIAQVEEVDKPEQHHA